MPATSQSQPLLGFEKVIWEKIQNFSKLQKFFFRKTFNKNCLQWRNFHSTISKLDWIPRGMPLQIAQKVWQPKLVQPWLLDQNEKDCFES